jgi:hypothetical protein
MGKQQLTVSRSRGDHEVRLRTSAEPLAAERADRGADLSPLSVLAAASSVRLDDPRLEQERVVLIGAVIASGRDAARVLDQWLVQSLTEYRGSHSAWNLESTTAELRRTLTHFDGVLRDMAARLQVLIPDVNGASAGVGSVAVAPKPPRVVHELAVASRILATLPRETDLSSSRALAE